MTQFVVAVLLTFAVGGHWALLQTAAWITMAVTFAQTDPLPVALKKTFDGQHPCQLCEVVEQGRQAEQLPEMQIKLTKLDLICYASEPALALRHVERELFPFAVHSFSRFDPPPTPPPIAS